MTRPVLVVDDDAINRHVATEELALQGYSFEIAENGREALSLIQLAEFRLVLMDCQMPIMDGFAATREIRKWENSGDLRVPIVALTGHGDDREREKARAAGMDDFLTKPLHAVDLRRVMEQFPGGRRKVQRRTPPPELTPGVRRSRPLIDLFLEHVPAQLIALRTALGLGDTEAVSREAHKLKGTCLAIAADPMAAAAEALRDESSRGDLSGAEARIADLDRRLASVEMLIRWEPTSG